MHHLDQFDQWANQAGMQNASFVRLHDVTHMFVTLTDSGDIADLSFSPVTLDAIVTWHRQLQPHP